MCEAREFPVVRIGVVDSNIQDSNNGSCQMIFVDGIFGQHLELDIDDLRQISESTFPALFA
jgi:hypothetical protein